LKARFDRHARRDATDAPAGSGLRPPPSAWLIP
jgi:hypothetical protein